MQRGVPIVQTRTSTLKKTKRTSLYMSQLRRTDKNDDFHNTSYLGQQVLKQIRDQSINELHFENPRTYLDIYLTERSSEVEIERTLQYTRPDIVKCTDEPT